MKKVLCLTVMVIGIVLTVLSVLLPMMAVANNTPSTGIIGGADAPTFAFLFREQYAWLMVVGLGCVVAAVAALLWRKK